MATVYSSLMTEYSGATGGWRSYLTYTVATTDTEVVITCYGGVRSDYWSFAISSNITSTLSCTGQSSVSGSGGLNSNWSNDVHNQLVSKTYTIARTSSTQTVTVSCSTKNASGYINGTAVANVTITIPALDIITYNVQYDANGGMNPPTVQSKTKGVPLIISSTKPTRTNYTFVGWNTDTTATTSQYFGGDSYTADENIILYAIWSYTTSYKKFYFNIPD